VWKIVVSGLFDEGESEAALEEDGRTQNMSSREEVQRLIREALASDKPKLLDCFCGMGGVSDGFALEGFDVTGIDIVDAPKMLGYKHKFKQADMKDLWGYNFQGYDVIWGSPPCRHFTILNDARWKEKKDPEKGMELINVFLDFVKKAQPTFWIMENVFGLEKYLPNAQISKAVIGGKRHVFYGNFPPFLLPQSSKFKIGESCGWDKLAHWKRSKIPLACSRAFAVACRQKLLEVSGV